MLWRQDLEMIAKMISGLVKGLKKREGRAAVSIACSPDLLFLDTP
jgi:hypothetical protein